MAADHDAKARHEKILARAREHFRISNEAEAETRQKMRGDLRFYAGDQWPEHIKRQREQDKKPVLTFPVIQQFVHQVTNDIRQNTPAPVVTPVGDGADPKTAEVHQGLILHVGRRSNADVARDYAAFHATVTGRGWYRIVTDWEAEDSFDQDIFVKRIKSQESVYPDPSATEADYSDGKFLFVVEKYLPDDFEAEFGKKAAQVSFETLNSCARETAQWWALEGGILVAEYYYVEEVPIDLVAYEGPDGAELVLASDDKRFAQVAALQLPEIRRRKSKRKVVKWCRLTGLEVLEEKLIPCEWIPVIPILGEEIEIDGKTELSGMVRHSQDAQRQYNFMRTASTETIALAPRSPWVVEYRSIEKFKPMWDSANTRNWSYLPYEARVEDGELIPGPQRQNAEPPIQAMTIATQAAYEDLKRQTGIHDASLGSKSNETSGIAIQARQQEGDTANFHYIDNVSIAVRHECRCILSMIPKIYDRPGRVARIVGDEGEEKTVTLNQQFDDKGIMRIYDVRTGRYDLSVDVGPSYTTKRKQMAQVLMELTKAYPALMQVAGDLVLKSLDVPGAREVGERLKKMLPPELQDADEGQAPIPPQFAAQLAQLQQLVTQLQAELQQASMALQTKQIETESKERIETMRIHADLVKTQAQIGSQQAIAALNAEVQNIGTRVQQMIAAAQADQQAEQAAEDRAAAAAAEQARAQAGGLPAAA